MNYIVNIFARTCSYKKPDHINSSFPQGVFCFRFDHTQLPNWNWGDIENRKTDELYEFPIIIQVVIKSFGRTTDRRIKEKKGITQVWKFSSQWHRLGNSYLVTQPSRNLTEQGLNLMCGRERCRRCGIMTRRLIIFFYLPKGNKKKKKKSVISPGKIKNERKIRQLMKIRIRL